jgi:hypothetical protein
MNSNTLSLLGCSGSLAVVLLFGNAANADTLTFPKAAVAVPPATQNTEAVLPVTSETPVQVSPQIAAINPNSDTVGDLAIARFHCDCPACRVAIVQMLQTGQLSL